MVHDPRQEKMNPALISPLTATLNESTETIIYRPSWGGGEALIISSFKFITRWLIFPYRRRPV